MDRSIRARPGETVDRVCGALEVFQAVDGYRFGMEALFLCGFVSSRASRVLDLGTGSGVIPLVLLWSEKADLAVGIEIQPAMCERARRSAKKNRLSGRMIVVEGDLRGFSPGGESERFDLVTANPPFYPVGRGRSCRDEERALAREERLATLDDFIEAASRALLPRGKLAIVFSPRRIEQALCACRSRRLSPSRLRFVHPRPDLPPRHVLLEARLGTRSALDVEAPLFIEDLSGQKTPEFQSFMYPDR